MFTALPTPSQEDYSLETKPNEQNLHESASLPDSDTADTNSGSFLSRLTLWPLLGIGTVLVLLLAGLGYFSFFCNNEITTRQKITTQTATNTQQKTINMIGHWKGEDKREDYMLEIIREFEARHPDIKVNLQWNVDFPGGRAEALQAVIDQIKSGDIKWDVIWIEPFNYSDVAEGVSDPNWAKNHLVDFETVPGFKETQKPFVLSDPQFRNHMNGTITGPFIEGFYQPFFYNKELTDLMGIKIKEQGMTDADLIGYLKAIQAYNKQHGTQYGAFYDNGSEKGATVGYGNATFNLFQGLFRSEISDLTELKKLELTPTKRAALRKTLATLENMSQYEPLVAEYETLEWVPTRNYPLDNKTVFYSGGASWMYSHWRGIDKDKTMKMVPVEMPMYQPVTHYMGGYNPMFAVMKNSPVKDEAVSLLMEYSTPNNAEKWIRYAKGPSGIKGNLSESGDSSQQADQFDKYISYISNKYGGNVYDSKTVDYILGEKYEKMTRDFRQYLVAVLDGKMTADQAYNRIVADMKAIDNETSGEE
ncbi:MAG TPA: ABC transporter substrate-binding protein [Vitreimonas sp.]|nr:ABC transporter substrate-binding protein [Vitreimonas sp.]